MSNPENTPTAAKTTTERITKIKNMSWEKWSDIMLVVTGIVAAITFVSGLWALYVGYRSGKEKDAKAQVQAERIADLEVKFTEAETKRLEAEKQLLELQERFSPRTISPAQKQSLLDNLKKAPASSAFLTFQSSDGEAYLFAKQLKSILEEAKWEIGMSGIVSLGNSVHTGITILVRDANDQSAFRLQEGLQSIGYPAPGQINENLTGGKNICIDIGVKPLPEAI